MSSTANKTVTVTTAEHSADEALASLSTVDCMLLDMDGTLLDLNYDNHFWLEHLPKRYADIHGGELDEAQRHIVGLIREQRGTLNWYCTDFWSRTLKLDVPALKQEMSHLVAYRPGTVEFLTFLTASDIDAWIVTNAHRAGLEIKLAAVGLGRYFPDERIISSHDYQIPKEDQRFWHRAQQHIGFNHERTLFVDDNLHVLRAAAEYGIDRLFGIAQPSTRLAGSAARFDRISVKRDGSAERFMDIPLLGRLDELIPALQRT